MNFKDSERPWLMAGAVGAVAVVAASWFFAVGPELSNASAVRGQVADAQTQNDILQSKSSKLKNESEQLPTFAAQLKQKLSQLPNDAEFSLLTKTMYDQAKASDIDITTFNLGNPSLIGAGTISSGTIQIPLTLVASGSMNNQQKFLRLIQQVGPRAALISSTQFAPASNSAGGSIESNATMTAQLTVFWSIMTTDSANALQQQLNAAAAGN